MIIVVLQNRMDLLKGEVGSASGACVTATLDPNHLTGMEAERVSNIKEEDVEEPATIPVIKTEPNVSCVPLVSVTCFSYRLYPELPANVCLSL